MTVKSMPITPDYRILIKLLDGVRKSEVIMTYITEKEELDLDNKREIYIHRGKRSFKINNKQIYCYGEIDFDSKEDVYRMKHLNFLNHLGAVGFKIYSNYDYKKHECTSPNRCLQWTETWNPVKLIQYAHGCLNKPKRIVLFNSPIK